MKMKKKKIKKVGMYYVHTCIEIKFLVIQVYECCIKIMLCFPFLLQVSSLQNPRTFPTGAILL